MKCEEDIFEKLQKMKIPTNGEHINGSIYCVEDCEKVMLRTVTVNLLRLWKVKQASVYAFYGLEYSWICEPTHSVIKIFISEPLLRIKVIGKS